MGVFLLPKALCIAESVVRDKRERRCAKPPFGWVKVNCDAALEVHHVRMGVGIVIRDHEGVVIAARSFTIEARIPGTNDC